MLPLTVQGKFDSTWRITRVSTTKPLDSNEEVRKPGLGRRGTSSESHQTDCQRTLGLQYE